MTPFEMLRAERARFVLESGEWLMVRFSGTEPLMRCYLEARSKEGLEKLRAAGKELTQV